MFSGSANGGRPSDMSETPLGSRAASSASLELVVPTRPGAMRPSRTYRRGRSLAEPAWRLLRELTFVEVVSAGMLIVSLVASAIR